MRCIHCRANLPTNFKKDSECSMCIRFGPPEIRRSVKQDELAQSFAKALNERK
jgi:hypothetical protein